MKFLLEEWKGVVRLLEAGLMMRCSVDDELTTNDDGVARRGTEAERWERERANAGAGVRPMALTEKKGRGRGRGGERLYLHACLWIVPLAYLPACLPYLPTRDNGIASAYVDPIRG